MDRRKCGTAIHIASDAYGMPLGAVVTAANVNDSTQTQAVLEALVVKPPAAETPVKQPDRRDLAHSRADGAYGNRPSKERAAAAGFRMEAPTRGKTRQPGVGKICCAVEAAVMRSCLSSSQGCRGVWTRTAKRYLGWVQLAACVIFIRL